MGREGQTAAKKKIMFCVGKHKAPPFTRFFHFLPLFMDGNVVEQEFRMNNNCKGGLRATWDYFLTSATVAKDWKALPSIAR